jgi:insertion element IS1 protein InsB
VDQKKARELTQTLEPYTPSNAVLSLELDELHTFVQNKNHPIWLWVALERETRKIVAWVLGDHSNATFWHLWDALPGDEALKCSHAYATDAWRSYDHLPRERRTTRRCETNHVKRWLGTLRSKLGRVVRRSYSFSKSRDMLEAALVIFIAGYNASR